MDARRAIWLKVQTVTIKALDGEEPDFICIKIA
jgi:hypothetical protein